MFMITTIMMMMFMNDVEYADDSNNNDVNVQLEIGKIFVNTIERKIKITCIIMSWSIQYCPTDMNIGLSGSTGNDISLATSSISNSDSSSALLS